MLKARIPHGACASREPAKAYHRVIRGDRNESDHRQYQNFIDGEFIPNSSGSTIAVINPATEEVISEVPNGTAADADAAVLAAERAQKCWCKLPAIKRAGYLREIAEAIRQNKDALARTIVEEQGKILPLAEVEVNFTADYMDYMAEFARRYEGEIIPERPSQRKHSALQDAYRRHRRRVAVEFPVLPDRPEDGASPGHRKHHCDQAEQ